ncbi:MAG: hypothetical protein AB9835_00465 [Eubacteriales bacterium]
MLLDILASVFSPPTSDAIIPLLITAVAAAVALLVIRKFRSGK